MIEAARTIWAGLEETTPLDRANLALGVVGVWLMIRRSLWAFPLGLLSVSVQGILFYNTRFYADAALQVFFFWTLAWGWWHWVRDRGRSPELPVSLLSRRSLLLTVGFAGVGTFLWAFFLQHWTNAIMPLRDAFIASFSIAAQVLQARKNLENWAFWIVVNAVAIASYFRADLVFTAFLYAIYLLMAVLGWRSWRRAFAASLPHAGT